MLALGSDCVSRAQQMTPDLVGWVEGLCIADNSTKSEVEVKRAVEQAVSLA